MPARTLTTTILCFFILTPNMSWAAEDHYCTNDLCRMAFCRGEQTREENECMLICRDNGHPRGSQCDEDCGLMACGWVIFCLYERRLIPLGQKDVLEDACRDSYRAPAEENEGNVPPE